MDIISKAINHYGADNQLDQLTEECAELIQAINKFKRAVKRENPPIIEMFKAKADIIEEIADVEIMIEQARIILDISEVDLIKATNYKLNRLKERIENE